MKETLSLKIVQEKVKNCEKCDLCTSRKNAVPGKGNHNEDECGEPFIGTAGKKLNNALKNAGLERSDVYITNIVKCRPPKNRIPNDVEKMMCSDYLENELSIIKPKIICLLGNTSYHSILGGNEISKNHGKFVSKDGYLYFISFHPAAIIYNQKLEKVFKNDMKKLVNELKKLKTKSGD